MVSPGVTGRVLQVEVDKVRQTQWVPGGNVRAAKIAAGPLARCVVEQLV